MPQNINLFVVKPKSSRGPLSRFGVAAIVLLLAGGAVALHRLDAHRIAQARAELPQIAAESARLQRLLAEVPNPGAQLASRIADEEKRVVALEAAAARLAAGALGGRTFSAQLRGLGRTTADGVWLTGIRLDRHGTLTLDGRALHAGRVPVYIDGLRRESLFAGTAFASIELKALDERDAPVHATSFRLRGADMRAAATEQKDMLDKARERERKVREAALQAATAPAAPVAPVAGGPR
jgi:hypothetical protein